jgi:hypothetical protein
LTKPRAEWEAVPKYATRTEMLAARRREKTPHASYDFDGDGVVGQKDYFIGRHFDEGNKGFLKPEERDAAVKALNDGWIDQFVFGLDQAGAMRKLPISQKRGIILTIDNGDEIAKTYPTRPKSGNARAGLTKTELDIERKADLMNAEQHLCVEYDKTHLYWAYQKPVEPDEYYTVDPPIGHISERAQADAVAARVANGLHPVTCFINPDRESQALGLGYVKSPPAGTRREMQAQRKAMRVADLEYARRHGERTHIPKEVFLTQRETAAYEYRRQEPGNMTQRRMFKERLEKKLAAEAAFQPKPLYFPRFEDQEQPWWTLRSDYVPSPPEPVALYGRTAAPDPVPPPQAQPVKAESQPPAVAPKPAATVEKPHLATRSFTSDLLRRGAGRNQPRLFDSMRPGLTYNSDLTPLDYNSSLEGVRKQSMRNQLVLRMANEETPQLSRIQEASVNQSVDRSSFVALERSTSKASGRASERGDRSIEFKEPRQAEFLTQSLTPRATVRTGGFQLIEQPVEE